jgi:hypothetical protein
LPSTIAKSSNGMGLQYYWRQGQGYPGSSLAVTTGSAWVALDFNASCHGRWSGVGTLELGFSFGLVIRPGAMVVGKAKGVWS